MTSCSSVASTSYACAYRSSCCRCSSCRCLSSSYLVSPLVSLKIVRWWEGRQLPRTRRGSCLKTVPAYGFRSQAGFTLFGAPQPETQRLCSCTRPSQSCGLSLLDSPRDDRQTRSWQHDLYGVFSAVERRHRAATTVARRPSVVEALARMSPGVTGSKNPPATEPGRPPAVN